jgi:hypothetical protein
MVQAGIDLYKVQRLLGHKSPIMTQRYAHHYPESLREGLDALEAGRSVSTSAGSSLRGFSKLLKIWSRRSGLNGRPAVYETAALPTELRRPLRKSSQLTRVFSPPQGVFRSTANERCAADLLCPTTVPPDPSRRYLNWAIGCSLTEAPRPGPGRQRDSCPLPYCS